MRSAFDLQEIRKTLQQGIDSGRWTLEDLDRPAPGTLLLQRETEKHPDSNVRILSGKPFRNLLREVAQPERVEAAPSARDFAPPSDPQPNYDF